MYFWYEYKLQRESIKSLTVRTLSLICKRKWSKTKRTNWKRWKTLYMINLSQLFRPLSKRSWRAYIRPFCLKTLFCGTNFEKFRPQSSQPRVRHDKDYFSRNVTIYDTEEADQVQKYYLQSHKLFQIHRSWLLQSWTEKRNNPSPSQ